MDANKDIKPAKVRVKPASRACDLCRKLKVRCVASADGCRTCKIRDRKCTYQNPRKRNSSPKSPPCDELNQVLLMRLLSYKDITQPEINHILTYFESIYPQLAKSACISPHDFQIITNEGSHQEFALAKHLIIALLGFHLDLGNPTPSDNTITNYAKATALIPYLNPTSTLAPLIQASLGHAFQCATTFTSHPLSNFHNLK
ncbi:hypothetical protein DSO57_1013171 [Entomophthora muscae]|uniref:Uncharacterized protein n=1 Tax=Entomophthora muscae TaxID=34485 RepID=A0ACC2URA7_9FUNG|nr:hypothetical protein DSO57_1013171 [Entomophthora muscae]